MLIGVISLITGIGVVLIVFSYYFSSTVTDIISKILVGPSIVTMFIINVMAWAGSKPEYMTF